MTPRRRFVSVQAHRCHADGCDTAVPPKMFMCRRHWALVPKPMQARLWAAYVPGQETRKDPSMEYINVARTLIDYVRQQDPPKPVQGRLL